MPILVYFTTSVIVLFLGRVGLGWINAGEYWKLPLLPIGALIFCAFFGRQEDRDEIRSICRKLIGR